MKIKKGDNVMVITGKDKGKKGAVVKALPKEDKVIVAGVNIAKKHTRPRKAGEKGQVVDKTMPVHISNVKKI
jgi:large subunit ribosomal protein L24